MRHSQAPGVDQNSADIAKENGNDTRSKSTQQSHDITMRDPHTFNAAFQNSKDVTIKAKNQKIDVHSYRILFIPYFIEIFATDDYKNMKTKIIIIKEDIDLKVMPNIIEYTNSKELHLTKKNVFNTLKAAKVLKVDNLVTDCYDFIGQLMQVDFKGVSQTNVFIDLDIESLENLFSNPKLRVNTKSIYNFIIKWVTHDYSNRKNKLGKLLGLIKELPADFINRSLYEKDIFRDLDFKSLRSVLSIYALNNNTAIIFNGIMKWVTIDYENRETDLAKLLDLIDMSNLSADYINRYLYHEENNCIGHYFRPLAYELHSRHFQSTINKTEDKQIIVIATVQAKSTSIVEYDPKRNEWSVVRKENYGDFYLVIVNEDKFYKFQRPRKKNQELSAVVKVYDFKTKIWEKLCKMNIARKFCGAVFVEGFLYAFGGYDIDNKIINSVERYSLESKQWEVMSPMIEERCAPAVIVFDDHIYVIGGRGRGSDSEDVYLDTIEVYDIKTNKWSKFEERMENKRSTCAAAVLNEKIYVCGGWYNEKALNFVEMFDTKLKRWKTVKPMNKAREQFLVVEIHGKLWAIGGCSKEEQLDATSDSSVEVYDFYKNSWSYVNTKCIE
ncbi:kelch-like protein 12 isoform X2 [Nasonia vitripennis]|uniref:Kelch-like protein diablo n=1 Tax=Nasonia vitripennis TaxID=7425 RepID=A0A7M7QRA4_NASVI|nr:kelch-like protein 12 isoform X2 [Nasonia vitripennis]